MNSFRIPAAALVVLLTAVPAARAQDNPVLPDLIPREVEIRGELTIRFPSLRRQPLVGFNPPPRIPDVSTGRSPFAEPYKQERADLPPSPLRAPSAPAVASYLDGPRYTGQVEGGLGRYTERFVVGDLGSRSGSDVRWTVSGAYRGRSGFEAWPGTGAHAEYEQGELGAAVSAPVGQLVAGASMDAIVSQYLLYGVVRADGDTTAAFPEREVKGGTVGAFLARNRDDWRFRISGAAAASSVRTDVAGTDGRLEPGPVREDRSIALDGSVETLGRNLGVWLAGSWSKTDPTEDDPRSAGSDRYGASGGVRIPVGGFGSLKAGLGVIGASRDGVAGGDDGRTFTYVAPDLRLDAALGSSLRLVLSQHPRSVGVRLADLYAELPFIVDAPIVEPEVWPVDASGTVTAVLSSFEVSLSAHHRRSPNRRWFEHDPTNVLDFVRGISSVSHGEARETEGSVDVTAWFGASVQAGIGASVRDGRLTELDADIPYFASWTVRSLVSAGILDGRGLLQVTARVEGPRQRDLAGALDELPAFADLDFLASYRVTRGASIVMRLENVGGNRPEWDRYLRPPTLYSVGLAWEW